MLHVMVTIAIAGFFLVTKHDTEFYPNGIFIPLVVEVVGAFAMGYTAMPLIRML